MEAVFRFELRERIDNKARTGYKTRLEARSNDQLSQEGVEKAFRSAV